MQIHSRAGHWCVYMFVMMLFGPHSTTRVKWNCAFSHRAGRTVCFQRKEADNQKIHASLKSIPNCYIVRHPQTSDQMMSCTINSPCCLSLSLLHFTTHASTSHLRNGVGNCVTVAGLIHHVCVMSVFMLSLHVCVEERTSVLG